MAYPDLTRLKNDLLARPELQSRLAGGDHRAVTEFYNRPRADTAIELESLPVERVLGLVAPHLAGLTTLQLAQLDLLLRGGSVSAAVLVAVAALLPKAGKEALDAARRRPGSLAESLFGEGTVVTHRDVARALAA